MRKRHRSRKRSRRQRALAQLGRYKALAQMIGGFVHQLRTPIHIIQSSADDLAGQRRFMPNFKPQAELIARSAQRMEASVNALLNFVRGDTPALRPGFLNEALSLLGDFLENECKKRTITIEKKLQSQALIRLDPHALQEAILNLLTNALQAMPRGGTLSLQTEDAGACVRLRIRDTGVGMDRKTLANLAVPFRTSKHNGIGLGLFFTRKILYQHQARLKFISEKGRGTTVTLTFPAA